VGMQLRFYVFGLSRFRHLKSSTVRGKFLTDCLTPVVRAGLSPSKWQFVSSSNGRVQRVADRKGPAFVFEHRVEAKASTLFFALTFPYPLEDVNDHVDSIKRRMKALGRYAHHEHLLHSLGGLPVELLTLTGGTSEADSIGLGRLPPLAGLDSSGGSVGLGACRGRRRQASRLRPWHFPGRRAVFISARVHPGETPASFLLEGILDFLASDSAAA
ncbi:unnamed protein product, partial [Polarella glacialis]